MNAAAQTDLRIHGVTEFCIMPYLSNDDLPISVRGHLPEHGQEKR